MASNPGQLPSFHRPPVDEVAVGVQFNLEGFLPTHYGSFHDRVKSEFPGVQALPPLPPINDSFSTPTGAINLSLSPLAQLASGWPPWPRALFVSADDCSIIQLQRDRLYFNWRQRPIQEEKEYRRYSHLRSGFSAAYSAFETWAAEQRLGPVAPTYCEIVYVNPLPFAATGVGPSEPDRVFRVWSKDVGEEWKEPPEGLAFTSRYQLHDDAGEPCGRLTVTMSTAVGHDSVSEMRLELAARGTPRGAGLDGILAFHDIGHAAIVRCFAAITTPAMHARWDRHQ
jgi:uncharacterized protein (TIGR04255 family)